MAMKMKDMGSAMKLLNQLDVGKISKLAEKVDLNELIGMVSSMDEGQLAMMMKMAKRGKKTGRAARCRWRLLRPRQHPDPGAARFSGESARVHGK